MEYFLSVPSLNIMKSAFFIFQLYYKIFHFSPSFFPLLRRCGGVVILLRVILRSGDGTLRSSLTLRDARLRGAAHTAGAGLREVTGEEEETLGAKVGEEVARSVVPSL